MSIRKALFFLTPLALSGICQDSFSQTTINTPELIGVTGIPEAVRLPYPVGPDENLFRELLDPLYLDETLPRIRLGKALFWDEQLSTDNTVACGTCHRFSAGGGGSRGNALNADGTFGSKGVFHQSVDGDYLPSAGLDPLEKQITHLNAPTVINSAFFEKLFWLQRVGPGLGQLEGTTPQIDQTPCPPDFVSTIANPPIPGFERFAALEALSVMPILSDIEMGHAGTNWTDGTLVARIEGTVALKLATSIPPDISGWVNSKTYGELFTEVFGLGPNGETVTRERFAMALAHYQRSLVSDEAPVLMPDGLTSNQQEGLEILLTQSTCFMCHSHSGAPVVDPSGGFVDKFDGLFTGGFRTSNLSDTNNNGDAVEAFNESDPCATILSSQIKIPSLLNIGLRRHLFHSGQITSVVDLVDFLNGDAQPFGLTPTALVFPQQLNPIQKAKVVDLLENGFTDPRVANEWYPFDRPDLYSERIKAMEAGGPIGNFQPNGNENHFGVGVDGSQGPLLFIANSPAFYDAPGIKVGLGGATPTTIVKFYMSDLQFTGTPFYVHPGLTSSYHTPIQSPLMPIDANGFATFTEPLINHAVYFAGTTWYGQWLVLDSQQPGEYATTDAAAFVIQ